MHRPVKPSMMNWSGSVSSLFVRLVNSGIDLYSSFPCLGVFPCRCPCDNTVSPISHPTWKSIWIGYGCLRVPRSPRQWRHYMQVEAAEQRGSQQYSLPTVSFPCEAFCHVTSSSTRKNSIAWGEAVSMRVSDGGNKSVAVLTNTRPANTAIFSHWFLVFQLESEETGDLGCSCLSLKRNSPFAQLIFMNVSPKCARSCYWSAGI